ncbi:MAG: nucleoside hydrolase, partial [Thermoguttaceae bacterium]
MARKVILDVDPGVDDALALCWALFNPGLEVVAVTAVGGNCAPAQATRNAQAIIEALDPPRWPRLGAASEPEPEVAPPPQGRGLYGPDGLGGVELPLAERQHLLPAEKVICDQVRAAPDAITIVA